MTLTNFYSFVSTLNSQTLQQLGHLRLKTPTRAWTEGRLYITDTSARFIRLTSRRLWSHKPNGWDVLGPFFGCDHPIDYGGLWGPRRLLHGFLLGSPHLLDLLVDGLLMLPLPGSQGKDRCSTRTSSPLLATLLSPQMVPPPTQQLPPRPPLVQVAQPEKERIKADQVLAGR